MCYAKKHARVRVLDDFVLHPPLRRPLWVATLTCSGRTGASKHKCLGAMEMSTNQPSGQPEGGWGGAKTCQNSNAGSFFGNWRGGVGLRRAIVARLWGCHVIAPAPPSIPRIILLGLRRWGPHQKTAQNSNSGRFFHRRGPRSMPRKEPPSRRSLATERLPEGGGGGGEGGETVQNSSSGAFLAEGIYLNRRGSKITMLLGRISILPFLAPPLPRQRSITPHAGRW